MGNQSKMSDTMSSAAHKPRTVVLSLDYDGCMDVLFKGAHLRLSRRNMTAELKALEAVRTYILSKFSELTKGASRVVLMVGSNRQSIRIDQHNRMLLEREVGEVPSDVGSVRVDFSNLASSMGWELNKALLADKVNGVPAGTAWENSELDYPLMQGKDNVTKKELIEFQFSQLQDLEGPIDFYFFDDRSPLLDYVRETLVMDEQISPLLSFHTVHFDWFSHVIEHAALDLHAVDIQGQSRSLSDAPSRSDAESHQPHLLGKESLSLAAKPSKDSAP